MYYTGIGSRTTPDKIQEVFYWLGKELAARSYILRSGGAQGADESFEKGCDAACGQKEIYLPWKGFNGNLSQLYGLPDYEKARKLAEEYHPCFGALKPAARKLMTRNSWQVLGRDLETPSEFLICWTPDGNGRGGTGQALRIARAYGIKICDFGGYPEEQAWETARKIISYADALRFRQLPTT